MYLLYSLYNGILLAPRLASAPLGAWHAWRGGEAATEWAQRFGYGSKPERPSPVWIQAASVGEVRVASRLFPAIASRLTDERIALTTTTRTGQALARSLAKTIPGGGSISCSYFPFDFRAAVLRTVHRLRPRVFVMIETELWPNVLRECRRAGVRSLVVNGRLSPRSFTRYKLIRPLMRSALGFLDLACVQTEEDGRRFAALGLPPERIRVTGNMKYDLPAPPRPEEASVFRASLGLPPESPVIVAGSTAEGEDPLLLDAFERVRKDHTSARLILAPRHPERFGSAAGEARRRGFSVRLRTDRGPAAPRGRTEAGERPGPDVVILDTVGELMLAYAAANIAFVGGSLVPVGGQNMLEPASCGLAPIFGPHTDNFREPAERLLGAGGAFRVADPAGLSRALMEALQDPTGHDAAGGSARDAIAQGAGATERAIAAIEELLDRGGAARP
jgi:3-deoxy-D-manno-octulosonic-acid transferase